jgi:hypothetical protein
VDAVNDSWDDFLKRLGPFDLDGEAVDLGPSPILPRHASPERVLILRGPSFRRVVLAVLVANLLTGIVVALALQLGLGKALSSDETPAPASDPVLVSVCSPGGC